MKHLSLASAFLLGSIASVSAAAVTTPAPGPLAPRAVPQSAAQMQLSFAPLVAKVAPAVVNVYTRRVVSAPVSPFMNDPFFQQFFGNGSSPLRSRVQQSLGSGVIVRSDGTILTNNHVIEGATEITVALSDRREFPAKVVLADSRTDLAVLRIDSKGETFPSLAFGDSDRIQVGDLVLAIGDPFGVGQTVTSGIVSALSRTQVGASDYQFFIQTDAAINPGNSGGALVSMDGRLIGINSSIVSQSGGNAGIGFAIPANMANLVVEGALGGGIKRPWFGADGQAVTSDIARSLGLTRPGGVLVSDVYPGSPAAQAGIVKGDIVLSIDGFDVEDAQGLRYRIATHRPDTNVAVRFSRAGKPLQANVRLITAPDQGREETALTGDQPFSGAKVANITPALAEQMQFESSKRGVVVTAVGARSVAANVGVQPGDLIRAVNGKAVNTVADLKRALTPRDGGWDIAVERGGQVMRVTLR